MKQNKNPFGIWGFGSKNLRTVKKINVRLNVNRVKKITDHKILKLYEGSVQKFLTLRTS